MELVIKKDLPILSGKNAKAFSLWRDGRLRHLSGFIHKLDVNIELLRLENKTKVLDTGCGFGFEIMELTSRGCDCTGLDIHEGFIDIARTVSNYHNLEARFDVGDSHKLPYPDYSFDAVMSDEFFSHVKDIDATLSESIRVLKVGGRLFIRDGNILCPPTLFDLLVLYPIRTRSKNGGIKWLLNRNAIVKNLYGHDFAGKDEDIKSLYWWRKKIKRFENLKLILATTSHAYETPRKFLKVLAEPFWGQIMIVAQRIK
ncbi:class I SAM-dependent methyltransferase [Chloroflexota bacterium]